MLIRRISMSGVSRSNNSNFLTCQAVLISHVAKGNEPAADAQLARLFDQLTRCEREMVTAIVRGSDYREIAAEFFISPLTAKTHIDRARIKVGARDRAQLVTLAYAAGIRPAACPVNPFSKRPIISEDPRHRHSTLSGLPRPRLALGRR